MNFDQISSLVIKKLITLSQGGPNQVNTPLKMYYIEINGSSKKTTLKSSWDETYIKN